MKTIGLLGGTGWSSTISYYKLINEMIGSRLGGFHSAKILLKSIDYHDIVTHYGKDHNKVAQLLKQELKGLIDLNPDCYMICCNSLHKFYDMIQSQLASNCLMFHAVDLVAHELITTNRKKVLLLATKFTMEDGFFAKKLQDRGIEVIIPNSDEREKMHSFHNDLMQNIVTSEAINYFSSIIKARDHLDAVILGCTEYPLVVNKANSALPIIDPVILQATKAVDFALK